MGPCWVRPGVPGGRAAKSRWGSWLKKAREILGDVPLDGRDAAVEGALDIPSGRGLGRAGDWSLGGEQQIRVGGGSTFKKH